MILYIIKIERRQSVVKQKTPNKLLYEQPARAVYGTKNALSISKFHHTNRDTKDELENIFWQDKILVSLIAHSITSLLYRGIPLSQGTGVMASIVVSKTIDWGSSPQFPASWFVGVTVITYACHAYNRSSILLRTAIKIWFIRQINYNS